MLEPRPILRSIEDTDTARSTRASEEAMVRDLQWLGLDWDEGELEAGDCSQGLNAKWWAGRVGAILGCKEV